MSFQDRLLALSEEERIFQLDRPRHELGAKDWTGLHRTLTSFDYLEFKCREGRARELTIDYDAASRVAPPESSLRNAACAEWRQFFSEEAHHFGALLESYPQLVEQQALNQPDGAVHVAATSRRRGGAGAQGLLVERLNRPSRPLRSAGIAIYPRRAEHIVVTDDTIAVTSSDRSAEAWNLANYDLATRPIEDRVPLGDTVFRMPDHAEKIEQLSSLAGGLVAASSRDGRVRIWDPANRRQVVELAERTPAGGGFKVLAAGPYFVTAPAGDFFSSDYSLKVWTRDGDLVHTMPGHAFGVRQLSVLDDERVVSFSHDGTLRVWEPAAGTCSLVIHDTAVEVADYVLLGSACAVSFGVPREGAAAIRIWSLDSGELLHRIESPAVVREARAAMSGSVLCAAAGEGLWAWDVASGRPRSHLDRQGGRTSIVAATADERRLITAANGRLRVWDVEANDSWPLRDQAAQAPAIILENGMVAACTAEHEIAVWELDTGRIVTRLEGHTFSIRALHAAGPERLASFGQDDTVRLWQVTASMRPARLDDVKGAMPLVIPAGDLGLTTYEKSIRVWNLTDGTGRHVLEHASRVQEVMVLPDGRVVSSADDEAVRVWDPSTGRCIHHLQHPAPINALRIVAESRVYTTADDGVLRVWDADDGVRIGEGAGHAGKARPLDLANGQVATSGDDGDIRIWSTATGECLRVLRQGGNPRWVLRDGAFVSDDDEYVLRVWRSDSDACERVWRGHESFIDSLVEEDDGAVVSKSHDRTLRRWTRDSDECVRVFSVPGLLVSWKREGNTLAASWVDQDSSARMRSVWDWDSGEPLSETDDEAARAEQEPAVGDGWQSRKEGLLWRSDRGQALYPLRGQFAFVANEAGRVVLTESGTGEIHLLRVREDVPKTEETQAAAEPAAKQLADLRIEPVFSDAMLAEAAKGDERVTRVLARVRIVYAAIAALLAVALWLPGGWWRVLSAVMAAYALLQMVSLRDKGGALGLDIAARYHAAIDRWRAGRHAEAIAILQELEGHFARQQNSVGRAAVLMDLAALRDHLGDGPAAVSSFEEAARLLASATAAPLVDKLLERCLMAEVVVLERHRLDDATLLRTLDSLKKLAARRNDDEMRRMTIVQQALIHARAKNLPALHDLANEYGDREALMKRMGIDDVAGDDASMRGALLDDALVRQTITVHEPQHHAHLWMQYAEELTNIGEYEHALRGLEQAEIAARAHGQQDVLQAVFSNQAVTARLLRRVPEFRERLDIALALAHTLDDEDEALVRTLEFICEQLIEDRDQPDLALQLAEELELVGQKHDSAAVLRALSFQTSIHRERGDFDAALAVLARQEQRLRETNDDVGLYRCLELQADVWIHREPAPRTALALLERAEEVARRTDNPRLIAGSLLNQASMLIGIPNGESEGLRRAEAAVALTKRHGHADLQKQAESIANRLRQRIVHPTGEAATDEEGWLPHSEPARHPRHATEPADPEAIRKAVVPLLQRDKKGVIENYSRVDGFLGLAEVFPGQAALGVAYCYDCDRPTFHLSTKDQMPAHAACSECGVARPMGMIAATPDPRPHMRQIFQRHAVCVTRLDEAQKITTSDPTKALALAEEAEAICRELGNTAVCIDALTFRANVHGSKDEAGSMLALYEEAVEQSDSLGDPHRLVAALTGTAMGLAVTGRVPDALSRLRRAEALCHEGAGKRDAPRYLRQLEAIVTLKTRFLSLTNPSADDLRDAEVSAAAAKAVYDGASQKYALPNLAAAGDELVGELQATIERERMQQSIAENPDRFFENAKRSLSEGVQADALEQLAALREYFKQNKEPLELVVHLNEQGSLLAEHQLWDAAIGVYRSLLDLARRSEQRELVLVALSNLNSTVLSAGTPDADLDDRLREQERLARESGVEGFMMPTLVLLARAHAAGGRWEQLETVADEMERRTVANDEQRVEALRWKARAKTGSMQWAAAFEAWQRCGESARRAGNPLLWIESLARSGSAAQQLGDAKSASEASTQIMNAFTALQQQNNIAVAAQVFEIMPDAWPAQAARFGELYAKGASQFLDKGDFATAAGLYESALRLDPENPSYMNQLAWMRATAGDASVRNGREAVELSTKACDLTGWTRWEYVDTLAAALAECGEFAEAVRRQETAVELAPTSEEKVEAARPLANYRAGRPLRIYAEQH